MKKSLFIILLGFMAISAYAYDVCIDGIYYNLDETNKTAMVTYSDSRQYSGNVVIPKQITANGASYSVTSIGEEAFYWNYNLASVTIPNSVVSIGKEAFNLCDGLTSIEIPNSVTSIGDNAFGGCHGLISFVVDINNQYYCSEDNVLFNKDKTELINCITSKTGDYTIPNSVNSIAKSAFSGCKHLTSVTIPNSVTTIGYEAFYGCM